MSIATVGAPMKSAHWRRRCSGAGVTSARVAMSIRITGRSMVKRLMAKPGLRGALPPPLACAPRPPISTGTRGATQRARSGPVMRAVGKPKTTDQRMVMPVFAWRVAIAAIGPGCGGMRPCAVDIPAARGRARRRIGVRVSRASVKAMGPRRTMPTPKKTEMPTRNATSITA